MRTFFRGLGEYATAFVFTALVMGSAAAAATGLGYLIFGPFLFREKPQPPSSEGKSSFRKQVVTREALIIHEALRNRPEMSDMRESFWQK